MNNQIKILDCTLRDGGYYNDWDFDIDLAEKTISALNKAGVDIIEVGYKSRNVEGFFGLFKYCNEDYLGFLEKYDNAEYAFMLDVKEFYTNGNLDVKALDTIVRPRSSAKPSCCTAAEVGAARSGVDTSPVMTKSPVAAGLARTTKLCSTPFSTTS